MIIRDIAYVINCTDIFDVALLQPGYFFGKEPPPANLRAVGRACGNRPLPGVRV